MFVHVLDESGEIVAQDDGLAAAALQPGDLILLAHSLPLPATYTLRLGVYNPETGQQLTTGAGDSFVILAQK